MLNKTLLTVEDLVVEFPGTGRTRFRALKGVSIDIREGETVGLVGESGSGKTTLGRALLGLAPVTSGRITFQDQDIGTLSKKDRRALAADIQVVFQDPYSSLNATMTVEDILTEPLIATKHSRLDAVRRVAELLDQVGMPADSARRYANEFSGGQRQRVAIARALAIRPKLIVCDEPVSALDLSTQARVLDLFRGIQDATGVAYLFISHDLSVVRHLSHRVSVMYHGEIVESGDAVTVTSAPQHPYTQRLLLSTPVPHPALQRQRRLQRLAVVG